MNAVSLPRHPRATLGTAQVVAGRPYMVGHPCPAVGTEAVTTRSCSCPRAPHPTRTSSPAYAPSHSRAASPGRPCSISSRHIDTSATGCCLALSLPVGRLKTSLLALLFQLLDAAQYLIELIAQHLSLGLKGQKLLCGAGGLRR